MVEENGGKQGIRVAVMQPYLFPYIGYFQLMHAVDRFVLLDDVNYIVRGWVNRNRVLSGDSGLMFTLPLSGASPNCLISAIHISDEYEKWRSKFIKTLSHLYGKAPCYSMAQGVVEEILSCPERNLSKFLANSLEKICRYIGVDCLISRNFDEDDVVAGRHLAGEQRIVHIASSMGACQYINAIGGASLYSPQHFVENDLELFFVRTRDIQYPQFSNEFVAGLSIIDVMMFNRPERILELLTQYDLVSGGAS